MNKEASKVLGIFILHSVLVTIGCLVLGGILFYLSAIGIVPIIITAAYLVVAALFLIPFFSTKWAASVVRKKYPAFLDWNNVFIYYALIVFLIGGINPVLKIIQGTGSAVQYVVIAGVLIQIFFAWHFLLRGKK